MKKIVTTSLLLVLTQALLYCQTTFPKKIVFNSDTVCIITIDHVKLINSTFIDIDELNELNDSLNSQIKTYEELRNKQKDIILNMGKQLSLQAEIIVEKDNIIENKDQIISDRNRSIKKLKMQRNGIGLAAILVCVLSIL